MTRKFQGFDVGGSSVKAGLVDVEGGAWWASSFPHPPPQPATPAGLMQVIAGLSRRLPDTGAGAGVAFPSVVKRGIVRTAANIDQSWLGADGATLVASARGRPAQFLNDADAAGIAEMRWGAGRGEQGTVAMLTFGTGIGTALFIEGRLLPNTELGHLPLHGMGRGEVGVGTCEDDAEPRLARLVRAG